MAIRSICQTNVVTLEKTSTLKAAAQLMQEEHVGSIIIVERLNGRVVPAGIITDRDIALTIGSWKTPQDLRVEQIMQTHPITINVNEGIYDAILVMRKKGIKRLPVTNDDGSLFGVISADEVLKLMGDEINNLAKISDSQLRNEKGIRYSQESHAIV
jgi:CBS domain-containing protein